MSKSPEFKPGFTLLDVTKGRTALKRHIEKGNKVLVTALIEIDRVHGMDDGISREFSGRVLSHSVLDNADVLETKG